jgi:hypothetical protein
MKAGAGVETDLNGPARDEARGGKFVPALRYYVSY